MSTNNLCFEQKYEIYQIFFPEKFQFLGVKFSIYLNRHVFVMLTLKTPRKPASENVICLCRQLNILANF